MFSCYLPFLVPLHHLSSAVVAVYLSPADMFMSSGIVEFSMMLAANKRQGEQREGLSGKAGLPTITVPIKTAEQSPSLNNQIRPADRAAPQLDPTHSNKWDRDST